MKNILSSPIEFFVTVLAVLGWWCSATASSQDLSVSYLDVSFTAPRSLYVDSMDYLYVLGADLVVYDNQLQVVMTVDLTGSIVDHPSVAVDQSGDIYIADLARSGVQVLDSEGSLLAFYNGTYNGTDQVRLDPTGIAIDRLGNLVIVNQELRSIVILAANNGTVLNQIVLNNATFSPIAVDVNSNNWIYVLDNANNQVVVFNDDLEEQAVWTNVSALSPSAIAIDSSNNVYVTDTANNQTTVFNSHGDALQASLQSVVLSSPAGIAVSSQGRVFIGEPAQSRITVLDGLILPGSVIARIAGDFNAPVALAVSETASNQSRIYISNPAKYEVQAWSITGNQLTNYTCNGNGGVIQMHQPWGVAVSADARALYVVDRAGNKIVKFDTQSGAVNMTFATKELISPSGIAVHPQTQALYVTDDERSLVVVFSAQGQFLRKLSVDGLNTPTAIAISRDGNVYITDTVNNRIVVVNRMDKQLSTFTGFNLPYGVTVDAAKRVYVADSYNRQIVVLSERGKRLYEFDRGFAAPWAVALDAVNNIYVADYGANQIVVLSAVPIATTAAKQSR